MSDGRRGLLADEVVPSEAIEAERLDERLVVGRTFRQLDGTPGSGQTLMWARLPEVIEGGMTYEVLSMESYAWGMPEGVRE